MSSSGPRLLSRYSDWLRARRPRVRSSNSCRFKISRFSVSLRPAEARSASYPMGTGCSLSEVKQQERKADSITPTSAEVKKT
jgi:hypothetical protein